MPSSTLRIAQALLFAALLALPGCGKNRAIPQGGPGGGTDDGGGDEDGGGNSGPIAGGTFLVSAPVTRDSCGERVAEVTQRFTIGTRSGRLTVNTTIIDVPAVQEEDGSITAGFTEASGNCTRSYDIRVADPDSSAPFFTLTSRTECPGRSCETQWQGAGTETGRSADEAGLSLEPRVRGENCNPSVPLTCGFRPSLFECNGNAAVLMGGSLRNNFSVVVRRNGPFNDRDPNNPSCETNRCSPYKTQKRIELPEYQVNCLGDSGFSDFYVGMVNRISIKFVADVTNAEDPRQFEQYCLGSTTQDLN